MAHLSRLRLAGATAAAGALLAGGMAAAGTTAAQAATHHRNWIAGTLPAWAHGRAPAVTKGNVTARVYLAPQHAAGLTSVASAVSDPGSASYRHYLTAAQVKASYGPSRAEIAAVQAWVRSAGLTVTGVNSQLAGYVSTRGTVAAASRAFGVKFGRYKGPDGHFYRAPEQTATAPGSVASDVLTIAGLDTAPHLTRPQLPPPGDNYWIGHPCSSYYGQKIATDQGLVSK